MSLVVQAVVQPHDSACAERLRGLEVVLRTQMFEERPVFRGESVVPMIGRRRGLGLEDLVLGHLCVFHGPLLPPRLRCATLGCEPSCEASGSPTEGYAGFGGHRRGAGT